LLYFVELMDAIQTTSVFAIRTRLTTKTRTESDICLWEISEFEYLIFMVGSEWYLGGSDEPFIVTFKMISIFLPSWKESCPHHTTWIDHIWHLHRCKSFLYHLLVSILEDSLFKQRTISFEKITTSSCQLHSPLDIYHIMHLHQSLVISYLKIK
jgi:hypothetical protein